MAGCIANGLRDRFEGILPDEAGRGVESPAQSVRGPKKLDVNFSTTQLGLGFGISLKSVHFREKAKRGRCLRPALVVLWRLGQIPPAAQRAT